MGDDTITITCQRLKDAMLERRKPHFCAASVLHDAARQIDRQFTELQDTGWKFNAHVTSQRSAHARQQFRCAEGLQYVVVGAGFKRQQSLRFGGPGRQHENWYR